MNTSSNMDTSSITQPKSESDEGRPPAYPMAVSYGDDMRATSLTFFSENGSASSVCVSGSMANIVLGVLIGPQFSLIKLTDSGHEALTYVSDGTPMDLLETIATDSYCEHLQSMRRRREAGMIPWEDLNVIEVRFLELTQDWISYAMAFVPTLEENFPTMSECNTYQQFASFLCDLELLLCQSNGAVTLYIQTVPAALPDVFMKIPVQHRLEMIRT